MSAFMAQAGTLVVLGDAGEAWAIRSTRRGSTSAATVDKPGRGLHREADATDTTSPNLRRRCCERAGFAGAGRARAVPPLRLGPEALQFPRRPRATLLMREALAMTTHPTIRRIWPPALRESATFDRTRLSEIRRAAATGIYDIRGSAPSASCRISTIWYSLAPRISALSARRLSRAVRHRNDAGDALREKADRTRDSRSLSPGMSFGSLSAQAKEAIGRGATIVGTLNHHRRRRHDRRGARRIRKRWSTRCLPSRYGMNPDDLRQADAIEVVVGQGAKPGGGGMLLGQKVTERVAAMRTLPAGIDQRSRLPPSGLDRSR